MLSEPANINEVLHNTRIFILLFLLTEIPQKEPEEKYYGKFIHFCILLRYGYDQHCPWDSPRLNLKSKYCVYYCRYYYL